ncbi:hypothetical protein [Aneurinibacillus aneurinilyticus]|uniref:DUF2178 domain-containing protein n=2 Tax=Aneurinibacillus aneurinilyticus TaxID=1391 RepID=A0A848D4U3_ANEAE|nr:hypothetical protein [Aneurinibacillus aneurinilyticus]ERI07437.1 hypothetical protein HMPREF0083_04479 [Aneurinibacillus aneurinilyticus ATCC 12856]MED0670990.1 hypothetical protein [Aneurinibacillus aneurinilyticus]MED0704746.1 hypothetical protein [Aneurinibacillus aneurinilyticus]MED0722651.1 hypothetical protein [Aneurinibacillus aneurinilyticus]MED0730900.1 hypothetical protein [Aneurinibacillus aneurinilyticus]
MTETIGALIGLFGGAVLGLSGWFFGRKRAYKNRGLDERYYLIRDKARATSWQVTLAAMYILFFLVILKIGISAASALGILLLVQMGSWATLIFYYQAKY